MYIQLASIFSRQVKLILSSKYKILGKLILIYSISVNFANHGQPFLLNNCFVYDAIEYCISSLCNGQADTSHYQYYGQLTVNYL